MGLGSSGKIIRIGVCTAVIAAGSAACLAMGWQAGEMLHAKLSHQEKADAQALAFRFPDTRGQATAARPSALVTGLMRTKDQQVALAVSNPQQSVEKSMPPAPEVVASAEGVPPPAEPARDPAATAPVVMAAATPEPSVKPVAAVHRRPNAVLDDGQIASIKRRLHLTPSQERMWPAVESELRKLAVAAPTHQQQAKRGTKEPPKLELSSADVARLKTAALPLIMSFNEEQRGELRNMAHVTGLDRYAP
jgi:hypothetical protein